MSWCDVVLLLFCCFCTNAESSCKSNNRASTPIPKILVEATISGVIVGKELIVDSTTLIAWYKEDFDALYSFCGKFGFKVHTVICRFSMMPLWFIVTPANRNDAPFAIPLLKVVMKLYPFFKMSCAMYSSINELNVKSALMSTRHKHN